MDWIFSLKINQKYNKLQHWDICWIWKPHSVFRVYKFDAFAKNSWQHKHVFMGWVFSIYVCIYAKPIFTLFESFTHSKRSHSTSSVPPTNPRERGHIYVTIKPKSDPARWPNKLKAPGQDFHLWPLWWAFKKRRKSKAQIMAIKEKQQSSPKQNKCCS